MKRILWVKRTGWALLAFLIFIWLRSGWYAYLDQGIIVSKETTYLIEPYLDAENLDFRAGLNKLHSQGVTPENNAAVLLLQLVGPSHLKKEELEKLYPQLGLSDIPAEESVYRDRYSYLFRNFDEDDENFDQQEYDRLIAIYDKHEVANWRPWSREEFPQLAKWIEVSEKHIGLIHKAALKSRFYKPYLVQKRDSIFFFMTAESIPAIRRLAELITIHAFLMLDEEHIETAIEDILTAHRMSRLLQSSNGAYEFIAGLAFDSRVFKVEAQLLASQKLSPQQAAYYLSERQKIGPLSSVLDRVKVTDRVLMLESILDDWKMMVDDEDRDPWVSYRVDLNEILRNANASLDQALLSVDRPTHAERVQSAKKHEAQLSAAGNSVYSTTVPFWLQSHFSRSRNTELFSKLLIPTSSPISPILFGAEARGIARYRLVNVALLLEKHRFQTNSYPETLAELTTEVDSKTTTDPFSEQPFLYKQTETGYLIYSVGGNLKDDGGREYDSEPPADDIKIQIE